MSKPDLLPPNATAFDRAVLTATAIPEDMKANIGDVGRPFDCPRALLPWLAWALSVDEWNPEWSDETKRRVIASSVHIHRRKGTFGAVRGALNALGFAASTITEGLAADQFNGVFNFDGTRTFGEADHWAEYRVYLERPVTIAQAEELRRVLSAVAPVRCHLKALVFSSVANTFNGAISFDGANTFGEA